MMPMETHIGLVKGSVITGVSFPSFSTLRLKCVNFDLMKEQDVAALDLFFSGVEDMRIFNTGDLFESQVTSISRKEGNPVQFRFELVHGFLTVDCKELD